MFSEKQLEDMIFEKLQKQDYDFLYSKGLPLEPDFKWYRQPNLGLYGIADIIGFNYIGTGRDRVLYVTVIELKAVGFEYKHIGQLKRYMSALYHYTHIIGSKIAKSGCEVNIRGVLVVKESKLDPDEKFALNLMNEIEVYDYDISISNGITFKQVTKNESLRFLFNKEDFKNTSLPSINKDILDDYKASRSLSYFYLNNKEIIVENNPQEKYFK